MVYDLGTFLGLQNAMLNFVNFLFIMFCFRYKPVLSRWDIIFIQCGQGHTRKNPLLRFKKMSTVNNNSTLLYVFQPNIVLRVHCCCAADEAKSLFASS